GEGVRGRVLARRRVGHGQPVGIEPPRLAAQQLVGRIRFFVAAARTLGYAAGSGRKPSLPIPAEGNPCSRSCACYGQLAWRSVVSPRLETNRVRVRQGGCARETRQAARKKAPGSAKRFSVLSWSTRFFPSRGGELLHPFRSRK